MKTVLQSKDNAFNLVLYMAFELSDKKWKVAFGNGQRTRLKTIAAGDWSALRAEIELAKTKLNCQGDAHVVSCYEAGRDGFWIHRALQDEGIESHVLDSASIEVSRRRKQVKTDRIDAGALLRLLMRYKNGEKAALHPVRVPTVAEEDRRRLDRERDRLLKERGAHSARIKSLLVAHGIRLARLSELPRLLPTAKAAVTGYALPADLKAELEREYERYVLVDRQLKALERLQRERAASEDSVASRHSPVPRRCVSIFLITRGFSMQAMTAALKIVLEFALDIARQFSALLYQMSRSAGGGYTSNSLVRK